MVGKTVSSPKNILHHEWSGEPAYVRASPSVFVHVRRLIVVVVEIVAAGLLIKVCVIKSVHWGLRVVWAPPPSNSIWLKMEQLWWFNLHVNNQRASRKSSNKRLFITGCISYDAGEWGWEGECVSGGGSETEV